MKRVFIVGLLHYAFTPSIIHFVSVLMYILLCQLASLVNLPVYFSPLRNIGDAANIVVVNVVNVCSKTISTVNNLCNEFLLVPIRLRSTTHPKFDPTWVRTHDFKIMVSTFHAS